MKNVWKTWTLGALLAASLCPALATAAIERTEPISTVLVAEEEPVGYPDPICSKCTIIVIEEEESAGTSASVRVGYPVDAPSFEGEIELTVWLTSGERRTVWISGVSLQPGDEVELVAEAGSSWSWDQVRFVWLRFLLG